MKAIVRFLSSHVPRPQYYHGCTCSYEGVIPYDVSLFALLRWWELSSNRQTSFAFSTSYFKAMKLLFQLLNVICIARLVSGSALPHERHSEQHHDWHEARYDSRCDFPRAYSILSGLSDGRSYCYSHIYPRGVPTRTVGTTVTVTGSHCRTKTKIVSESSTYSFQ